MMKKNAPRADFVSDEDFFFFLTVHVTDGLVNGINDLSKRLAPSSPRTNRNYVYTCAHAVFGERIGQSSG